MRHIFLLLLFFVATVLTFGQPFNKTFQLDSLYKSLTNHPQEDTTRANLLTQICYYEYTSNPEKEKLLAEEAQRISKKINYTKGIGLALRYISLYYWVKGDYQQASEFAFEMLKTFENTHDDIGMAKANTLMGLIQEEWGNFEKSKEYHLKSLALNKKKGRKYDMAYNYNSLGVLYMKFSKEDSGTESFLKSLELRKEIKDEDGISQSYINLASNFEDKDYVKAIEYLNKAWPIAKKWGNQNRLSIISNSLGEIYTSHAQYKKADVILQEALAIAQELGNKKMQRSVYENLLQLEEKRSNYKQALTYSILKNTIQDSLFTTEKAKQIAEMEARYETEKKNQTIQLLQRDKRIQQLWANIFIVAFISLVILFIVVYFFQRYREHKNRKIFNLEIDNLIAQRNELSEKYKQALASGSGELVESHDQLLLKKAIQVVERNIGDPLFGVEQMADQLNISRASLNRKLKAITGFPPSELIRNIRLRKAASLLHSHANSVTQISIAVGFEDQSYFSKSFKKQFGVTPSEYLKSTQPATGEVGEETQRP